MSFSETISPLLGRCALVWFYASGAMNIVNGWSGVAQQLTSRHVPLPPLILGVLIVMTSRLWRAKGMPERKPPLAPTPQVWPAWSAPYGYYAPYAPYGSFGQPAHVVPGGWPAPAAMPQSSQPMGGAQ